MSDFQLLQVAHQDLEVEAKLGVDLLFNATELLQEPFTLLGCAQNKHLHLAELVHPVQAPVRRACTSDLPCSVLPCPPKFHVQGHKQVCCCMTDCAEEIKDLPL